ncbi:type IX secretion system sortase PorU [Massilibacteroides sp.]|uniref:type IX secretion system sortase PorU n=1 Tax=Massilibacteroides sp. TaxID=2034766 RepID=UPI0026362156|nr:type IX secretion system sortase PorU [Massilibacteroides sp.]MDD4516176.1 type IX secretion system sortase PorU [Massilibacteroides sp.]
MLRLLCLLFIICITSVSSVSGNSNRYTQKSVLSEGRWVKIKVNETGIYKLTAADLKKMGFSDISKVSVFGYGGWMLDEYFSENNYTDDLPEVATWKGDGDFILFYAKGPIRWKYPDSKNKFITHEQNPYSTAGYYFLSETTEPLRMKAKESYTSNDLNTISTYDDYMLHEEELVSPNSSGRELFGESFKTQRTQSFTFPTTGITNDEGKISVRFIAKATSGQGTLSTNIDGTVFSENTFYTNTEQYTAATEVVISGKSWYGDKQESTKISLTYTGASSHENVYLDYIRIQMKRELRPYGDVTLFRDLDSGILKSRFVIRQATANMVVFDVSEPETPEVVETSLSNNELSFNQGPFGVREYALVQTNGTIPTPELVGEIDNQNLHGLEQQDMVIIAPTAFTTQAERLAEEHRNRSGLSVFVADPQTIYNEFSSGTPDASAYRRFMKMFYDRSTSEKDAPKYLLLFGDGGYDNRQLTSDWKKVDMSNFLLTFQSQESIRASIENGTYVTDDYFGFLDDNSGSNITTATLRLGIGRFPVRTISQAKSAVDKVITYMDNKDYGSWKNIVTFVADDGNSQDGHSIEHVKLADEMAESLVGNHPEFITKKLYFDAHKKDNTGGFATYPTIKSGLQHQLKDGTLLINYVGHGSKDSWSDEKVLTQADINLFSYTKLPLWITATCDFTPFDALMTSAGEDVFLNKQSGGIALLTTMRVAYANSNKRINNLLINHLFKKTDGEYPTLGEVIQRMKNDMSSFLYQKLNFILIGDPALRLNYPTESMRVTEINGEAVSEEPVMFKALEKITIKGEILNNDGSKNESFNGEINPTVFDSQEIITTLVNNTGGSSFQFRDHPYKLFVGNDKVANGDFEFSFTVPKDISYSGQAGKMNLYAVDSSTGLEANGAFSNYSVGGTGGDSEDKEGPGIISLYLNDSTFNSGDKVNVTPLLIVRLWDETGVNITGSSIGHDITLTIDGKSSLTYTLNSYYTNISDSEGEGLIQFPIPELTSGVHTAELKVWDILNNATTENFSFEVVEGLKPRLSELTASPSPARETVTFYLYHNRPESRVKVNIMVYDMMGRLHWKGETEGYSNYGVPISVEWDLNNGAGGRLRPGIYIYRAAISANGSKEVTGAKKLIILAQ